MIPIGELVQYTSTLENRQSQFDTIKEINEFRNIMMILNSYEFINNSITLKTYTDLYINSAVQSGFMFFKLQKLAKTHNMELIRMICKVEKSVIMAVLQMTFINSKIAGNLLTGKDDYFFDIKESQGWLYKCKNA